MADQVGRVEYELGVDMRKLRRGFDDAAAAAKKSGKQVESAWGKSAARSFDKADRSARGLRNTLGSIAKSTKRQSVTQGVAMGLGFGAGATAGATLVATALVTVKNAIGGTISAAADFDAAMTKSTAIMGGLSEAMREDMADAARDMAKATTFSAEQAADSYFYLASAGLDATQSIEALPKVAAFAQAGMFDMSRATDLLTDAQSALGLTVEDTGQNIANMTRVSDVLVKANTLANASVEQFSTALTSKAGAALKSFGIDLEEGVAVLAAFADQGVKAEEAGNALDRILRLLPDAAADNAEAFERLGISVFDTEGELRNLGDIVGEMEAAFEGLSDAELQATLKSLGFEARVQAIIKPLIGASRKIKDYEDALRDAGGTTERVADKQLDTFNARMELVASRVNDVAIGVGTLLLPALEGIADVGVGVIETLQGMADGVAELLEAIEHAADPQKAINEQLAEEAEILGLDADRLAGFVREEERAADAAEAFETVMGRMTDGTTANADAIELLEINIERFMQRTALSSTEAREAVSRVLERFPVEISGDFDKALLQVQNLSAALARELVGVVEVTEEDAEAQAELARRQRITNAAIKRFLDLHPELRDALLEQREGWEDLPPPAIAAGVAILEAGEDAAEGLDKGAQALKDFKAEIDKFDDVRGIKAINKDLEEQRKIAKQALKEGNAAKWARARAAIAALKGERDLNQQARAAFNEQRKRNREHRQAERTRRQLLKVLRQDLGQTKKKATTLYDQFVKEAEINLSTATAKERLNAFKLWYNNTFLTNLKRQFVMSIAGRRMPTDDDELMHHGGPVLPGRRYIIRQNEALLTPAAAGRIVPLDGPGAPRGGGAVAIHAHVHTEAFLGTPLDAERFARSMAPTLSRELARIA